MMKNISNKTLKIIQVVACVFYALVFAMAYFKLLDKNISLCAILILFVTEEAAEFILSYRKIKENKDKDNQGKAKSSGIIIRTVLSYVLSLFLTAWMLVLLAKVTAIAEFFG